MFSQTVVIFSLYCETKSKSTRGGQETNSIQPAQAPTIENPSSYEEQYKLLGVNYQGQIIHGNIFMQVKEQGGSLGLPVKFRKL